MSSTKILNINTDSLRNEEVMFQKFSQIFTQIHFQIGVGYVLIPFNYFKARAMRQSTKGRPCLPSLPPDRVVGVRTEAVAKIIQGLLDGTH